MSTPIIYSQPGCVRCRVMSKRFSDHGIEHRLIDVTADFRAHNTITEAGFQSVPVFDLGAGLTDSLDAALAFCRDTRNKEDT